MDKGIRIVITDQEIGARLDAIDRVAADPSAIMSAIAGYMVTAAERHIQRETGPEGGKWPRLSPRTAATRIGRRRRGHEHILRRSGQLYKSLTAESGTDYAAAGTNVIYAGTHHFGASIERAARKQTVNLSTGRGRRRFVSASAKRKETLRVSVGPHTITIPARPYLYLNDQDRAEILNIAADGLRREGGLE